MVTWTSTCTSPCIGQDGYLSGIYAQVLTANGAKGGSEFQVNTYTTGEQYGSVITTLNDGNVMIAWTGYGDGHLDGVYGQVLTGSGAKVGPEFQINTYTTGQQTSPVIARFANGNVLVTWESACSSPCNGQGQDGDSAGIYGQILTTNGAKLGSEFRVNSQTLSAQYDPALTALNDGNMMVVWTTYAQDGSGFGIYGHVFTASGVKVGTEFQINTYTLSDQLYPAITTLADGNVLVNWYSYQQTGNANIYGQILTASGIKVGTEFQVNTYTPNNQIISNFVPVSEDNVMAIWVSDGQDGSGYGVYGQVLKEDGIKFGTEFQVNVYTIGAQADPDAALLANGNVMIVWQSDGQDGSSYGVYGRIISTTTFLQNNRLILTEGQTVLLSDSHLNAVDLNASPNNLQFTVQNVLQGRFTFISNPNATITEFTQQDINNGLVQFIHDGEELAPSYEVAVTDGFTPSIWHAANITFTNVNDAPVLLTNGLTIEEGQRLTLTEFNLRAVDVETVAGSLRFIVNNLQHGIFSWLNSTLPITQIYQQNITDRQVQFTHDGSELAPSYEIAVSDGDITIPFTAATINFAFVNDAPVLLANQLTIEEGASVILNQANLNAIDEETPDFDFVFSAEQIRFGEFRRASFSGSEVVTQFTRQDIGNGIIQFVHDGSDNPPSYQISVGDGGTGFSVPQAANVTFIPVHDPSLISSSQSGTDWIGLLPIILGAGGGGLLVFSIITAILVKRYRDQQKIVARDQIELKDLKQRLRFAEVLMGGNLEEVRQNLRADKAGEAGRSIIGGKWALINKIKREEAKILEEQTGYQIEFKDNETEVPAKIGSGYFGKVRLALNVEIEGEYAGRFVGVKKIKGESKIQASLQEATVQSKLADVVHIMPLYDAKETVGNEGQRTLYQFMLFAGFGSGDKLRTVLSKVQEVEQRERLVMQIAYQLLKGFAGMHTKGIYHLDFKPSNMVIDNRGKAYIIDFGCAVELGTGKELITDFKKDLGDFNYFSIERLAFYHRGKEGIGGRESYLGPAYDLWTLGLTLYELAANEHLLQSVDLEEEVKKKGEDFIVNYVRSRPAFRNPEMHKLWKLIEGLLLPEAKRLTAKEALKQFFGKIQDLPFADEEGYQQAFGELKAFILPTPSPKTSTLTGVKAAEQYGDKKKVYESAQDVMEMDEPHELVRDYEEDQTRDQKKTSPQRQYVNPLEQHQRKEVHPHSSNPTQTFFKPESSQPGNNNRLPGSTVPGFSHRPANEEEQV